LSVSDPDERPQPVTVQRQAAQYARSLIEASLDPLVTISPAGKITDVNEATVKVTGVPRAQLIGTDFSDYFTEPAQARAGYEQVFAQGFVTDFPLSIRHRDGRLTHVLYNASVYRDVQGQVLGVFAAARDVTVRKSAEEEIHRLNAELEQRVRERTGQLQAANRDLARAEGLLEAVIEGAGDPIFVLDPSGTITVANSAMRRLHGEDLRGQPLATHLDRIGPSTDADGNLVPLGQRAPLRALQGETVIGQHRVGRRPDGTRYEYLLSAAPIRGDAGTLLGAVVMLTDVTAQMEAAMLLRAALAEKEAALADNQALLREVHHRVKNNLQMLCDMIFLQMEAMPDREQHQDLEDAYSRIYAIARLHEQLYQSMGSGRVRLEAYLRRLARGFENLFANASITVEAAADGVSLDIDRAIHVGLIVNELVMNALKHAFPKGHRGEVTVALKARDDRVQLEVRDNGRGVPPDFELEQAKTLGLRTVRLLARRLEADVALHADGGTSFTLTFPVQAEEPVEPKP